MTSTPPSHVVDHVFLLNMFEVLERTQKFAPKRERAELIELLRPLRDQLVDMTDSPEELQTASAQMRHHIEQFAATSLGSSEAQQIIQLTDPNAVAQLLAGGNETTGAKSTFDELQELPRGRGLQAKDVADRIGPGLRAACGVTVADPPASVRRKVARRLAELCERLPADLRISVLAAFALHPETNHQFMQERMAWAARTINRDHPRAAVRRMRVAFRILAEQLDDSVSHIALRDGWHTHSLRALLRMDLDLPHLVEERVIVATTDNLTQIELRLSSSGAALPSATLLYGGEITRTERVTPTHTKFTVRLPEPLRAGEKHEYGVRFIAPQPALMSPFYMFTPLQPCERFSAVVRFGSNVPAQIWRIDGIPPRAIDDFEPSDGLLTPNQSGEVSLEFSRLHQGLSYGLRWSREGEPAVQEAGGESH